MNEPTNEYVPQTLTDFQNSFADRLGGKFATDSYLNIPPHLNYVAMFSVLFFRLTVYIVPREIIN